MQFITRPVAAQKLFDLGEWYFENFEQLDDLSVDVITTIIQDEKGFIWIGSQDGLLRYDGYEFAQFLPDIDDPNSIGGKYVQTIEEINGELWIGTYSDGLSIYNPEQQTFFHYRQDEQDPLSLADNDVRDLILVNQFVFLGTKAGVNLFTIDGRSLGIMQIAGCDVSMSRGRVNALLFDTDFIWIATEDG